MMKNFRLYHEKTRTYLLEDLKLADTFFSRLLGLMGRTIQRSEGLMMIPCHSIHSLFMRRPIDVLFLESAQKVLHKIAAMKPWRVSPIIRGSRTVVEGPAGTFHSIEPGAQLPFLEAAVGECDPRMQP